jgi:hypothetical protein
MNYLKWRSICPIYIVNNFKSNAMRSFFIIFSLVILQAVACSKNNSDNSGDCTAVSVTSSATGCGGWGIVVNGVKYPSSNIPTEFQQDGITVCASYDLYEDQRACACCGGTWANIKSMKKFIR